IGVATLNLGFGGEGGGGIYHSIYDDFKWFTTFDDTSFVYGRALAQTVGTAVMRLADAEVVPYQFTAFAETVGRYVKEVEKLLQEKQDTVRERNRQLDEGVFTATADPRQPSVPPAREELPPYLSFAPLDNAVDALNRTAERYERAFTKAQANGGAALAKPEAQALNATLRQSERALMSATGLPRRPWYRHQIYAPGFYTGYGVKTLPGVREAIEQKNWSEAEQQIAATAQALAAHTSVVGRTAALTAILLVPLITSAPADRRALNSAQPAASYTYRGTIRAVNARTGTLELITGVGMSLRVVRMTTAPTTQLVAAGGAPRLADLKPGDVVRTECRRTPTGLVADRVEKLAVSTP